MILITTTKKQKELIYKVINITLRETGNYLGEPRRLKLYKEIMKKRSRKGK